ncbi:single-stranded DNA-binding protein [Candidatus Azambacteria bacterium]|nr:single-stranded DNA-binding protein [Candidatus Azambacteria bacterium]MBI3685396.1 single-stranded DNA-binding protein [Candidatus Azambacteria bacterium]
MNLNKVMILGNLTRDPESRTTPSGQTVATFGVATNRFYTDQQKQKQQKVEFHNIVAWGRLGEICAQYLKKGQLVFAEGRIESRSWNAPDGTKKFRTEIIAENIQFGPKLSGAGGATGEKTERAPRAAQQEEIPSFQEEEIEVKDIPF